MQQSCISDVFYVLRDALDEGRHEQRGCIKDGLWFVTAVQFKELYTDWTFDQGMGAKDFPRGLVLSKILDIPGVCVDAKHRFEGGGVSC